MISSFLLNTYNENKNKFLLFRLIIHHIITNIIKINKLNLINFNKINISFFINLFNNIILIYL